MLALLLAASFAVVPELELHAGYMGGGSADPWAVALSVRGGVDFLDLVTLSALLVGVPGPDASYASGAYAGRTDPSGMSGFAGLAEIRLHSRGTLQLHLGGAAGLGQLTNWQCKDCTENDILHGHLALMLQGSVGFRVVPAAWRGFNAGAEFAVPLWNGQEDVGNLALHPAWQSRASPRRMWAVLATLGRRWP